MFAHRRFATRLCPSTLWRYPLYVEDTRRQSANSESASAVADSKKRAIGNDNRRAHPGMQHVAIDVHDSEAIQWFRYFAPPRQTDIEQRFTPNSRMHSMQNGIAIPQDKVAAQGGNLHMGGECALPIVEYYPFLLRR